MFDLNNLIDLCYSTGKNSSVSSKLTISKTRKPTAQAIQDKSIAAYKYLTKNLIREVDKDDLAFLDLELMLNSGFD